MKKPFAKDAALGTLARFTSEQLKVEIKRRAEVERARRNIVSAERVLSRAQERVNSYRKLIAEYGSGEEGEGA